MQFVAEQVDIIVIGGGHAGIEAALASARLGISTILFSMSLDFIGNLPCNPSIGGTAKGHLVREIDALGGEMGRAADACTLQSRMLNRGKGPAVHSLRAQVDRTQYHSYMKQVLENQEHLKVKQGEIVEIIVDETSSVTGVRTALDTIYGCKAVILCTGTFLKGKTFVGNHVQESGPDGLHAAQQLSDNLEKLGITLRRFKTGTPARVHKDSINYSVLQEQAGEEPIVPFSFGTTEPLQNIVPCHIAYTNSNTHDIIRENITESAMYSGNIEGVGARYCPSIEDKVVRFADKERHQLFIEPMGLDTKEMYIQGLSTSMPENLQEKIYKSIEGFENVEIMRSAYAIEYDCLDPLELRPTLELMKIKGFYSAGQINGTSGYEEAAAQGIVAGINAVRQIKGEERIVLPRSSSYIGTLIDDLVTKGCNEPYRMMTSRSEYRLILRQDNADVRLTPLGRKIGLIEDARWEMFHVKQSLVEKEMERIHKVRFNPQSGVNSYLEEVGTTPIVTGTPFENLLRRPQVSYAGLIVFDQEAPSLPQDVMEQVEINIKYAGYIERQEKQVEKMATLETVPLAEDLTYQDIQGLRIEAKEKLAKIKPLNVGQASRISGVSPADISVLLIYLEQQRRKGNS